MEPVEPEDACRLIKAAMDDLLKHEMHKSLKLTPYRIGLRIEAAEKALANLREHYLGKADG